MPYIWTEPALVLEHRGVSVYNAYKDDDVNRQLECHYTTDVTEQATPFDIRDLESFSTGEKHAAILKLAIERGEISAPADEEV